MQIWIGYVNVERGLSAPEYIERTGGISRVGGVLGSFSLNMPNDIFPLKLKLFLLLLRI